MTVDIQGTYKCADFLYDFITVLQFVGPSDIVFHFSVVTQDSTYVSPSLCKDAVCLKFSKQFAVTNSS
jgi:hypothetical protein